MCVGALSMFHIFRLCIYSVFQVEVMFVSDKVKKYILDQCTDVSLDKDTLIKTFCFTDGEIT